MSEEWSERLVCTWSGAERVVVALDGREAQVALQGLPTVALNGAAAVALQEVVLGADVVREALRHDPQALQAHSFGKTLQQCIDCADDERKC